MIILADTNILTALAKRNSSQYSDVRRSLTELRNRGHELGLAPQNLIEFASVATRPINVNGLGLDSTKSALEIKKFKRYFNLFDDAPGILAEWERLVGKYEVLGRNVHDAHLVAAMLQHGITHLITFNVKDFKRFDEIVVLDPRTAL